MCDVQGMSVTTAETKTDHEDCNTTYTLTCSQVFQVVVGFHVVHRVDVTLDLGFHVVIGVGRLTVQFHHAYAIPSANIFSSGCCSPTVSCHRQLNLNPKFLHISHRENGSFEVLSLHSPSVTVDRRQLVTIYL